MEYKIVNYNILGNIVITKGRDQIFCTNTYYFMFPREHNLKALIKAKLWVTPILPDKQSKSIQTYFQPTIKKGNHLIKSDSPYLINQKRNFILITFALYLLIFLWFAASKQQGCYCTTHKPVLALLYNRQLYLYSTHYFQLLIFFHKLLYLS